MCKLVVHLIEGLSEFTDLIFRMDDHFLTELSSGHCMCGGGQLANRFGDGARDDGSKNKSKDDRANRSEKQGRIKSPDELVDAPVGEKVATKVAVQWSIRQRWQPVEGFGS